MIIKALIPGYRWYTANFVIGLMGMVMYRGMGIERLRGSTEALAAGVRAVE